MGEKLGSELSTAIKAAEDAGKLLLDRFWKSNQVSFKGRQDIVTEADKLSEKTILSILEKEFPNYSVLSEESGETDNDSDLMWVVDPLDGTKNFSVKNPMFNVSICLARKGAPILGVVHVPFMGETFAAVKGKGAVLNGKKIHVSDNSDLSKSIVFFCHGRHGDALKRTLGIYAKLKETALDIRQIGAAEMELCYVACGRVDAFFVIDTKPWDVSAGSLIVTEAGGLATDLSENHWNVGMADILGTNKKIHSSMLEIVRG